VRPIREGILESRLRFEAERAIPFNNVRRLSKSIIRGMSAKVAVAKNIDDFFFFWGPRHTSTIAGRRLGREAGGGYRQNGC